MSSALDIDSSHVSRNKKTKTQKKRKQNKKKKKHIYLGKKRIIYF